jgi:hypothetical protein
VLNLSDEIPIKQIGPKRRSDGSCGWRLGGTGREGIPDS